MTETPLTETTATETPVATPDHAAPTAAPRTDTPPPPGPQDRVDHEPPPPFSPRRLFRSATDRKIAGVCGGLAEYFRIDPTIVRLGALVFALTGAGFLAYVAAWIIVPDAHDLR